MDESYVENIILCWVHDGTHSVQQNNSDQYLVCFCDFWAFFYSFSLAGEFLCVPRQPSSELILGTYQVDQVSIGIIKNVLTSATKLVDVASSRGRTLSSLTNENGCTANVR